MIRGFFREDDQLPRVTARLELDIPSLGRRQFEANFVIDTSSTDSCLHPRDAVLAGGIPNRHLLDTSRWRMQRDHSGIGGTATYYMVPRTSVFRGGEVTQRIDGTLDVARPTAANLTVPSVLGWDVLQHFAIRLDWSQRAVELV